VDVLVRERGLLGERPARDISHNDQAIFLRQVEACSQASTGGSAYVLELVLRPEHAQQPVCERGSVALALSPLVDSLEGLRVVLLQDVARHGALADRAFHGQAPDAGYTIADLVQTLGFDLVEWRAGRKGRPLRRLE
jgi:hypothetical protein